MVLNTRWKRWITAARPKITRSAQQYCLSSVPARKGKDVRAHFSAPPYGWSRDAVDAALISLFGTGHLRATTNGAPLKSGQLDQAKVSSTDFRVESATIDTRQRLKVRKLFQTAASCVQTKRGSCCRRWRVPG